MTIGMHHDHCSPRHQQHGCDRMHSRGVDAPALEPIQDQPGVPQVHEHNLLLARSNRKDRQQCPHLADDAQKLRLRIAVQFHESQPSHAMFPSLEAAPSRLARYEAGPHGRRIDHDRNASAGVFDREHLRRTARRHCTLTATTPWSSRGGAHVCDAGPMKTALGEPGS